MFPIVLDIKRIPICLIGNGKATLRRLELLDQAGAEQVAVFAANPIAELQERAGKRLLKDISFEDLGFRFQIAMIADFDAETSEFLADQAKEAGLLVNVEDNKKLCDYHVPAIVRRGDLLVTVSTGGKSPRLAKRLKAWLETLFVPEWQAWLKEIGVARRQWKKEGKGMKEIARSTDALLERQGALVSLEKGNE